MTAKKMSAKVDPVMVTFEEFLTTNSQVLHNQVQTTGLPLEFLGSMLAVKLGKVDLSLAWLEEISTKEKDNQSLLSLQMALAEYLFKKEDYASASKIYQLEPICNYPTTGTKQAQVLYEKGYFQEAEDVLKQALEKGPPSFDTLFLFGLVKQTLGKPQESIKIYQEILKQDSHLIGVYNSLASAYRSIGDHSKARKLYMQALKLNPLDSETHNNYATLLDNEGDVEAALFHGGQALKLEPTSAIFHYNIANYLRHLEVLEKAQEHYKRASELQNLFLPALFSHNLCHLKRIYKNKKQISHARFAFRNGLKSLYFLIKELQAFKRPPQNLQEHQWLQSSLLSIAHSYPFFLGYQNRPDRAIQSLYGKIICYAMSAYFKFKGFKKPSKKVSQGPSRLKVGFISGYFCNHSVWKIPLSGYLLGLSREKFEIFSYATRNKLDEITSKAKELSCHFFQSQSIDDHISEILKDKIDILIFPEIGMDPLSLQLAALRLAPIQCTGLGHPQTTGLKTIDYFLSSEMMESACSDHHYREKLIQLPGLGIYYQKTNSPVVEFSHELTSLRKESVKYLLCQSLFKYPPGYEKFIATLAKRVPNSQFVFTTTPKELGPLFFSKLEKAFQNSGADFKNQVVQLDRVKGSVFASLCQNCDLFLDSLGWSGFNTTLEAIEQDLLPITLEGKLARTRHTSAILKVIGLNELIASELTEFLNLAIELGHNKERRLKLKKRLQKNKASLYQDQKVLRSLEIFLENLRS